MRLFVSIDLPKQVCEVVAEAQRYLKGKNLLEGSFSNPTHAHLTLAFLGDVDEEKFAAIDTALCKIEMPSYAAHLGSLGYFERGDQVSVMYLSVVCSELVSLAQRVQAVVASVLPGFNPDQRSFQPHITLARVKRSEDASPKKLKAKTGDEKLRKEIVGYHVPSIEFTIDQFMLKESVLTSEGPVHTVRATYPCSQ